MSDATPTEQNGGRATGVLATMLIGALAAVTAMQLRGPSRRPARPNGLDGQRPSSRLYETPGSRINTDLERGVLNTGYGWWLSFLFFGAITGWAVICFGWQVVHGIDVYGNQRPNYWAIPIINFVFWAGVALSGTMISAILRLLHAGWRRPLTRMTETLTLCALMVAGIFPILHLGRPWVFFWLLPYPNERNLWPSYRSPLLWDASAIMVYLITSAIFWYAGLIPDCAVLRDRTVGWRRKLYGALALGWRGTDREWRRLRSLSGILTVMIIPVFVSLHTIVGWDFGMSIVPGWHETIFAPYFVCGALYSGCGAVLIIMYVVRRAYKLEAYVKPVHFDNIGKVLFAISLLWAYFFLGDAWSDWFSRDTSHLHWLHYLFHGYHRVLILLALCGMLIPLAALPWRTVRSCPPAMFWLGICVNIAMFSERVIVVIPEASRDYLTWGNYTPSWVDISISAGAVGLFGLLYTLAAKFVPLVSMWEIKEGEHVTAEKTIGGVKVPITVKETAIG